MLTPELLVSIDLPQFEDAETARRYLEDQSWPEAPVCIYCGDYYHTGAIKTRPGVYQCFRCRKQFTVTVGTVFHATKLPLHKWLQATAILTTTPCTHREMEDALGIARRTSIRLRRIIRPDIVRYSRPSAGPLLLYPFLPAESKRRPRPEHEMLKAVSAAVPHNIPHDRRADICQELVLALLTGDIEISDLPTAVWKMFHKVYKLHPTIHGPISLDAPIPGTDDLRLIDCISNEDSIWNRI